jgi:hypothetical protein
VATYEVLLSELRLDGNDEVIGSSILPTMGSILQHGYRVMNITNTRNVSEMCRNIQRLLGISVSEEVANAIISRLTLSADKQSQISLWSGGPQHVLVPVTDNHHAVMLQGIPQLLSTLFYKTAHEQTEKGSVFEEAFRQALGELGFTVEHGELKSLAGLCRELDAGVLKGDKMYLFECVSIERPMDYEIGNPKTFELRKVRLERKIDQALSLAECLRQNPSGANYDYSSVRQFAALVVSPFVEWIWDRSERLWVSDSLPRVVSAEEAFKLLQNTGDVTSKEA